MSEEAARELEERFERWDQQEERRNFIARMEHKLYAKKRQSNRSR